MISAEGLQKLAAQIEETPENQRDERFNESFEEGRVTLCMEDDIPGMAKPVYQGQGFDIYLVDASQECASLTNDLETACGVVVALHDDED
ncbi:hypothetical protein [Marinospirillum perlucidum]|uniref:hypothetical protein n=1 Tax=Marinospirillum perlucidum TaxID=1982602 RepID=UPI000DF1906C|nr:hypothetical protein [Marinospirillum perlucidum]